eukprot:CAMPEP_0116936550 /NCGR_PEP_ID=MMETSP0467-20121206/30961_1 /TAXON_ID=283647 /ORGANISM="Mesodinium pulex, Strain SPMC105" /LENGTH=145 /DNA_ID=CAMNT_0004618167 /DNA_START=237 /DNA_END=674 /DNA_ORIENTATION=-
MATPGSALAHSIDFDDVDQDLLTFFEDEPEFLFEGIEEEPCAEPCAFDKLRMQEPKSTSSCYSVSPSCHIGPVLTPSNHREIHRKQAIARWLSKRERRSFAKKKVLKSSACAKKVIPKRSSRSGRFVKCTTGFVSITELQSQEEE